MRWTRAATRRGMDEMGARTTGKPSLVRLVKRRAYEHIAKSGTFRAKIRLLVGARGVLVRLRQTNRAADRRYDVTEPREF